MAGLFSKVRKAILPARQLEPGRLALTQGEIAVTFRRHAKARRLVLRLTSDATAVVVTVPPKVSRAQALGFAERSRQWIEDKLAAHGGAITLAAGSRIPLRGQDHEIRHLPILRGTVTADPVNCVIHVPGDPAHIRRRLADWLKRAAKEDLHRASQKYANAMELTFKRVTIRDQRSRWGSCSATGELSYSWRLILTPGYVLDYVAAHEVAHLKHMDHSPRFWRLVLTHCPDTMRAKRWLKAHGQAVHRVSI